MIRILPYKKILMNAIVAFFIYGTWAYVANNIGAYISALTQGSMSFILTVVLAIYLEIIYSISKNFRQLVMYVLVWFSFIVTLQASIHYVVGTEHIFLTLLPGMIIGILYMTVYLIHLHKSGKNDEKLNRNFEQTNIILEEYK